MHENVYVGKLLVPIEWVTLSEVLFFRTLFARVFHVCTATVHNVVNSFVRRGTVTRQKGSGRPRKTTPRSDRLLVRLARSRLYNRVSCPLLRLRWGEQVSSSTLRRRLKEANIRQFKPPIKPFLSGPNIEARLHWAMRRVMWRLPMYRRIVWTDESRFRLFKNDARSRVWRFRGERYRPDLMLHSNHSQGGSVHVWGAFWYGGRSDLQILQRNVTGEVYCRVITTFLERNNPPNDWILQQDNAPAHTSQVVMGHLDELRVRRLPWPSKSPDLNPIEHVWDFLGRKVMKRGPENLDQLSIFLREEWALIPQNYLDHLVEGMPRRIQAVIEADGGNTKY